MRISVAHGHESHRRRRHRGSDIQGTALPLVQSYHRGLGLIGQSRRNVSAMTAARRDHDDGSTSSFFDDYPRFYETSDTGPWRDRLNLRYEAIFAENRDVFVGARVLDIASHDGRWSLAALKAGAAYVVGIEGRPELVANAQATFQHYAIDPQTYRFVAGDVFEAVAGLDQRFDVVLCLGFLYHTLRYNELMSHISRLQPHHVIIDTEVIPQQHPFVRIRSERIARQGNAIADRYSHGDMVLSGQPSVAAVREMLSAYGFELERLSDWDRLLNERAVTREVAAYASGKRVTIRARALSTPEPRASVLQDDGPGVKAATRIEERFEAAGRTEPDYRKPLTEPGEHRAWVGGKWEEIGRLQLDFLVDQGLQPDDKFVDVGCGSLRAGRHLVDYLEPRNYFGIDVNTQLIAAGYDVELDDRLRARLPSSNLRATDRFDADFGVRFDMGIAQSLFTHLPLNHVRLCMFRIAKVMRPGARFYATFFEQPYNFPVDGVIGSHQAVAARRAEPILVLPARHALGGAVRRLGVHVHRRLGAPAEAADGAVYEDVTGPAVPARPRSFLDLDVEGDRAVGPAVVGDLERRRRLAPVDHLARRPVRQLQRDRELPVEQPDAADADAHGAVGGQWGQRLAQAVGVDVVDHLPVAVADLDVEHGLGDRDLGVEVDLDGEGFPGQQVTAAGLVDVVNPHGADRAGGRVRHQHPLHVELAVEVFAEHSDRLARLAVEDQPAVVEHERPVADLAGGLGGVRDEHDRPALGLELLDPAQALHLERLVADGEHFVDEQDVGVEVDGHGEAEADVHPGRVVLDRFVDELGELGELDDVVEDAVDLLAAHAVERGVDVDVLPAGEVGVEAGAELEERCQPAAHADLAGGRGENAGDALEQRRLARAVVAEDAERLALLDRDVDPVERLELLVVPAPEPDEPLLQRVRRFRRDAERLRHAVDDDGFHGPYRVSARWTSARSNAFSARARIAAHTTAVIARTPKYHSGPSMGSNVNGGATSVP